MRIVVFSDSHGSYNAAESVILRNEDADMFVHLGDGECDVSTLSKNYPLIDIRSVSGNCDFRGYFHLINIIDTEYARIFCTHGHRHRVKTELEELINAARQSDCNIVLYGHTHQRHTEYSNGIYFMNPGSCVEPRDGKPPSYGSIDLSEAGIAMSIVDLL